MSKGENFCFCVGELVDCLPGQVQDCNVKQIHKCPLQKKKEEQEALIQQIMGRKQEDLEQLISKQKKADEKKKEDKREFCFCLGELVTCSSWQVQDCNIKRLTSCPKEQEDKK